MPPADDNIGLTRDVLRSLLTGAGAPATSSRDRVLSLEREARAGSPRLESPSNRSRVIDLEREVRAALDSGGHTPPAFVSDGSLSQGRSVAEIGGLSIWSITGLNPANVVVEQRSARAVTPEREPVSDLLPDAEGIHDLVREEAQRQVAPGGACKCVLVCGGYWSRKYPPPLPMVPVGSGWNQESPDCRVLVGPHAQLTMKFTLEGGASRPLNNYRIYSPSKNLRFGEMNFLGYGQVVGQKGLFPMYTATCIDRELKGGPVPCRYDVDFVVCSNIPGTYEVIAEWGSVKCTKSVTVMSCDQKKVREQAAMADVTVTLLPPVLAVPIALSARGGGALRKKFAAASKALREDSEDVRDAGAAFPSAAEAGSLSGLSGFVLVKLEVKADFGAVFEDPDCCCVYLKSITLVPRIETYYDDFFDGATQSSQKRSLLGSLGDLASSITASWLGPDFVGKLEASIRSVPPDCRPSSDKAECEGRELDLSNALRDILTQLIITTSMKDFASPRPDDKDDTAKALSTGGHTVWYPDPVFAFDPPLTVSSNYGEPVNVWRDSVLMQSWQRHLKAAHPGPDPAGRTISEERYAQFMFKPPLIVPPDYYISHTDLTAAFNANNSAWEVVDRAERVLAGLIQGTPAYNAQIKVVEQLQDAAESAHAHYQGLRKANFDRFINAFSNLLLGAKPNSVLTLNCHGSIDYGDDPASAPEPMLMLMGQAYEFRAIIDEIVARGVKTKAAALRIRPCNSGERHELFVALMDNIASGTKKLLLFTARRLVAPPGPGSAANGIQSPIGYDPRKKTYRLPGLRDDGDFDIADYNSNRGFEQVVRGG